MIALLPLAAYFPGNSVQAFKYIQETDFFDIGKAPYYAAFLTALISGFLSGISWREIRLEISQNRLHRYLSIEANESSENLSASVLSALRISDSFRKRKSFNWQRSYIDFVKNLHKSFAVGEKQMCTIDEIVSVTIALLDFGCEVSMREMIELAVNYGRDNDTIASICAALHGAQHGKDNIPGKWIHIVQSANPDVDIKRTANQLAQIDINAE
jgi:ADP-ribosylglycohydrolase